MHPTPCILHLDMDAYFASIEQRDHPIYRGRPLMVCHTDTTKGFFGVVAAASYEARPYGVRSGMSVLEAKKLCPKGVYLMGDYHKYLHNTKELVRVCEGFTDLVELYSIDEMWLDITKTKRFFGGAGRVAHLLQAEIDRRLRLSASIGVGPNKLVAKMAGEFHKPGGLTVIRPQDLPDILAPLPVDKLVGVGRQMKKHLGVIGVTTIGDLAEVPADYLQKKFGVVGLWLKQAALGEGDAVLTTGRMTSPGLAVKSFGHSSALGSGEADMARLSQIMLGLCEGVTRRMRRERYAGRTVTLRLCLARMFGFTRSQTIPDVTDLTERIYPIAKDLLLKEAPVIGKYPATLIGVSVTNLVHGERQLSVFDLLDDRAIRLAAVTDQVKNKYGDRVITRATLLNWRRRYHGVEPARLAGVKRPNS